MAAGATPSDREGDEHPGRRRDQVERPVDGGGRYPRIEDDDDGEDGQQRRHHHNAEQQAPIAARVRSRPGAQR